MMPAAVFARLPVRIESRGAPRHPDIEGRRRVTPIAGIAGGTLGVDELRIDPDDGGCRLGLRVRPGGRTDRIVGTYGERLKLEVSAPPERGRANEAVRALLGRVLGLRRDQVAIVAGASGPDKVVHLDTLAPREVRRRLAGTLT
jgi:uncharacterized protein YggU (UPF0235/DUF167 family)